MFIIPVALTVNVKCSFLFVVALTVNVKCSFLFVVSDTFNDIPQAVVPVFIIFLSGIFRNSGSTFLLYT